ncbi:MAG: hypothetical protein QM780_06355 [Hyphomicrobium sp.]|uniref:hypothetical protein n=1 Tax=Hyphomicrobium sp. TaxID=82 RepID=UPI0039E235C2
MSRPGVFLLIAAGIALGGYIAPPPEDASHNVTEIARITVAPDRDYRDTGGIATFAPTTPTSYNEISSDGRQPPARELPKPGTWTTVVSTERSILSPVRSSRPADPETRSQLARDLQQELQRAGCYGGEINGSWTNSTRRAMAAFMDRANSVLPFNQPDYVLLALVQSHREIMCTADCPSGQVLQDDGRCMPRAVIAQAAKRQTRVETQRVADARSDVDEPREPAAVLKAPEREVLPWLRSRDVASSPLDSIALVPRQDPLPGRMSIGGPLPPNDGAAAATTESAMPPLPEGSAPVPPPKVASLQLEPDADDLSDGAATAAGDMPPAMTDADTAQKPKKSHHSDRDSRRRRDSGSFAYSGKRRHGDPRPGTARYNLMQSLGGIY